MQFANILVQVGGGGQPELHLDEDETAAAALTDGQHVKLLGGPAMTREEIRIIVEEILRQLAPVLFSGGENPCGMRFAEAKQEMAVEGLLLEEDILSLHKQGFGALRLMKGCVVTPLARDRASELGMELCREEV